MLEQSSRRPSPPPGPQVPTLSRHPTRALVTALLLSLTWGWSCGRAFGQPANDNCAAAIDVTAGATPFSTVGATTDGPDEPGSCVTGGYSQIGADVWFRYTSGQCASGSTTIATCG